MIGESSSVRMGNNLADILATSSISYNHDVFGGFVWRTGIWCITSLLCRMEAIAQRLRLRSSRQRDS